MSEQSIYNQLIKAGMSKAGACGLMGNMKLESAMRANNAQDGMTKMSDAEYTAAVDNGTYTNFARDAVGYGLCQWTYWTRKAALLLYAQNKGVSVGDEAMQVSFAVQELKRDYSGLWGFLCKTDSVYDATSRVCTEYERPAVNNISARYAAASQYYSSLSGTAEKEKETASEFWPPRMLAQGMSGPDVSVLQAILKARGYKLDITGTYDKTTAELVGQFQESAGQKADKIAGPKTWAALTKLNT